MNIVPLTIERCKELHKSGLYFKKHCPGLTAGWRYYQIKIVDVNKKTVLMEPMDNSYCPNWNPLGKVKHRIEDVFELIKTKKRKNDPHKKEEPEKKKRKRTTAPVAKEKPKKKRRRNT